MRLMYDFEMVNMDNSIIAVPVGDRASSIKGVIKLNKSGYEIMEMLKNEVTEKQIVDELANTYEDSPRDIAVFVHDAIVALSDLKLIIN